MLSDSDTFGSSPQHLDEHNAEGGVCCGGTKRADDEHTVRYRGDMLLAGA